MPAAGFEPTIPASERPQTHALDRANTEMAMSLIEFCKNLCTPDIPKANV